MSKKYYTRIINSSPMFFGDKYTNEKGIITELIEEFEEKRMIKICGNEWLPKYEYVMKIEYDSVDDFHYVEKTVEDIYKKYVKQ